jgi:hypothetical protein
MPRAEVTIKTRDGICPASVFTPADTAGRPWPAVTSSWTDWASVRPCGRWASALLMVAIWCCCPISITASEVIRRRTPLRFWPTQN